MLLLASSSREAEVDGIAAALGGGERPSRRRMEDEDEADKAGVVVASLAAGDVAMLVLVLVLPLPALIDWLNVREEDAVSGGGW